LSKPVLHAESNHASVLAALVSQAMDKHVWAIIWQPEAQQPLTGAAGTVHPRYRCDPSHTVHHITYCEDLVKRSPGAALEGEPKDGIDDGVILGGQGAASLQRRQQGAQGMISNG
jgi:hypothetical protein